MLGWNRFHQSLPPPPRGGCRLGFGGAFNTGNSLFIIHTVVSWISKLYCFARFHVQWILFLFFITAENLSALSQTSNAHTLSFWHIHESRSSMIRIRAENLKLPVWQIKCTIYTNWKILNSLRQISQNFAYIFIKAFSFWGQSPQTLWVYPPLTYSIRRYILVNMEGDL